MKKITLCLIAAAIAAASPLAAGDRTAAGFMQVIPDPQSVALGGSVMTLGDTPAGMLTNPAGTAYLYRAKVTAGDSRLADNIIYRFLGLTVPMRSGAFGLAAGYVERGDITGVTADGNVYRTAQPGDMQVMLNYALPIRRSGPLLREYGAIGANVKMVRSTMEGTSGSSYALDLGGIYRFGELSAGAVARNIGAGISYGGENAAFPVSYDLGARYDFSRLGNLFLVGDLGQEKSGASTVGYYSIGGGVSPMYPLTLRAAWKEIKDSAESGLRAGISFDLKDFSIHYAFSPLKDTNPRHFIGIDIGLGGFAQPRAAYDHYLNHYYEEASTRFSKRDYIGARQLFEEILSVYPDHEPSKIYLEKISQVLDEIEQQRSIEIARWLRKGNVALSKNNVFEARKYFNLVLEYDPENQNALESQAKIDSLVVEQQAGKAQLQNKKKIDELWMTAMQYYSRGEFVFAKEKFEELLRLCPGSPDVQKYLKEIDSQLAKVNAIQINDLYLKGLELYNAGNYAEAERYFNAVVIAAPERIDAQSLVADCQARIQAEAKKAKAEEAAQRQGKIRNEVEAAFNGAMRSYENGDYEEAIKGFARSRELASKYELARYVESSRNYITASKGALAERHYKLGLAFAQKEQNESAADEYRQALEYNPEHGSAQAELDRISDGLAQSYYEQGMRAFARGESEQAKELFKKSLLYKPDKPESLRALERMH